MTIKPIREGLFTQWSHLHPQVLEQRSLEANRRMFGALCSNGFIIVHILSKVFYCYDMLHAGWVSKLQPPKASLYIILKVYGVLYYIKTPFQISSLIC